MVGIRITGQANRSFATLGLALGLLASASIDLVPSRVAAKPPEAASPAPAAPETEADQKAQWQGRYRALRNNAVRMRENATKLRRSYGLAQHANYPRGGARERFKQQVLDTERKADQYEEELANFADEARTNGIPPGWISEVDEEPIDHGIPAAVADDEEDGDARDGRNPLYADDPDDDEASDEVRDADEDQEERGGRRGDDDDSDRDAEDDSDEDS